MGASFKQEIARPATPGPEVNPWFWAPSLMGVKLAPENFRERLHAIDSNLEITWSPTHERWLLWVKADSVKTTRGWKLLFKIETSDKQYTPLDERVFAALYGISGDKWGSGKKYFDALVRERERDREMAEKADAADTAAGAGEYYDYTLPKVGYGPISSSKVVGQ